MILKKWGKPRLFLYTGLMVGSILTSTVALAQLTTATIRGEVEVESTEQEGVVVSGTGNVVAQHSGSGFITRAKINENGSYILTGLVPGTYDITFVTNDGQEYKRTVTVQVGQSLDLDINPFAIDSIEEIVVVGNQYDTTLKTSEIGMNISRVQIENLPQDSRNFLNFAKLAPGVRLSNDPTRQQFASGALSANQTNYYIDGVNMKNNLNAGGGIGQDSSRGSPFSQMSVEGFRVITQNFKAEYEQAGSAIITAVSRSGGNEFEADVFVSYQNEDMVAQDKYSKERGDDKPKYTRQQFGGSISGPIIEDELHYFLSYEANYQDRNSTVLLGNNATDEHRQRWGHLEGDFETPFEEDLFFGKLNYSPNEQNRLELSVSLREEQETREVGWDNTIEHARDVVNDSIAAVFKHDFFFDNGAVNEFTLNYLDSKWAEQPQNNTPKRIYEGVINLGGHTFEQEASQSSITLRNNLSLPNIEWYGNHLIKLGFKFANYDYLQKKLDKFNPEFRYRRDPLDNSFNDFPDQVEFAPLQAGLEADNQQYGFFIQDDWEITRQFTLNIGIRYDYESNPVNKDFKTPDHLVESLREAERIGEDATALAAALQAQFNDHPDWDELGIALANGIVANDADFFDADRYISDGDDREPYRDAIQPRIGFSYDLFNDSSTVIYAGAGRYADRTLFNFTSDETIRFLNPKYVIQFTEDGSGDSVMWEDRFMNRNELVNLVNSGVGGAEMLLMPNDIEPVISDQFNIGVRQQFGKFNSSLSFSYIKSDNDLSYHFINTAQHRPILNWWQFPFNIPAAEVGNILVADNDRSTRYKAMYLTLEKPYSNEDKWGLSVSYTLSSAKDRGDVFELDFARAEDAPWAYSPGHQTHNLVASALFGLPYDVKLSVFGSWGSGEYYDIFTFSETNNDPYNFKHPSKGKKESFAPIDIRFTKEFNVDTHLATIHFEVFNILDDKNYAGYSNWSSNEDFGKATSVHSGSTRRAQLSLSYKF